MASSDSTGFHQIGWRFHQYSSSGQVLKATSEDTLELTEGSRVEGVMTFGTTAVLRSVRQTVLDSSSGALIEGFNVMTLTSDPAYATLPTPAQGTVVDVLVQGNSSNLFRITSNTSGVTINGNTSQYGVAGDSEARAATLGVGVTFTATGAASYRVSHGQSSAIAESSALL